MPLELLPLEVATLEVMSTGGQEGGAGRSEDCYYRIERRGMAALASPLSQAESKRREWQWTD